MRVTIEIKSKTLLLPQNVFLKKSPFSEMDNPKITLFSYPFIAPVNTIRASTDSLILSGSCLITPIRFKVTSFFTQLIVHNDSFDLVLGRRFIVSRR